MLNLVSAYKYTEMEDDKSERSNLNNSKMVLLHSLLSQYLDNEEPMVRFVAVRFISSVFPSNHVKSKYLLLLATGDTKDEVYTEALKALYGSGRKKDLTNSNYEYEDEKDGNVSLPSFEEMMNYVCVEVNTRMQKPSKCFSQGNHVLPFPLPVYKEVTGSARDVPRSNRSFCRSSCTCGCAWCGT